MLILIAEFAYNNAKNASTNHTSFELNCGYHSRMLYEEQVNPHFKSESVDKLLAKLRELMIVYQENLHHTQEFQKQGQDKGVKPGNYASSDKV